MTSPFVGIENVNEFYGEHYLSAILTGDLRATLAAWKDQSGEDRAPPQALAVLHTRYFRFLEQLERTTDPEDRGENDQAASQNLADET